MLTITPPTWIEIGLRYYSRFKFPLLLVGLVEIFFIRVGKAVAFRAEDTSLMQEVMS
jgi:hypothetical protein